MAHSGKKFGKGVESARAEGKARTSGNVASSTECTGLTPAEPEDLEEAYALGELYAVHTLKPSDAPKER